MWGSPPAPYEIIIPLPASPVIYVVKGGGGGGGGGFRGRKKRVQKHRRACMLRRRSQRLWQEVGCDVAAL